MTIKRVDYQRKISRWEKEEAQEKYFNYRLSAKDGLSLHEAMIANMSDDEYLDYCQATGRC